jgi:hypothetical protein
MRQTYVKGRAMFMVAMILSLPIYSAVGMAVLSNGYFYGETDNAKGHYRRNENVYINVTAWVHGDSEITPDQIHLNDLRGPIFNSCTPKGDGSFYCTYQMTSPITSNPYQLRLSLYDDNEVFDNLFILQGAFDEQAPEILSFDITPSSVSGGNVNFNYDIYEHAYSPTDTDSCSGVEKIELSTNGVVFETVMLNSNYNQCSTSGTITVPLNRITNTTGVKQIILTAYDYLNHQTSASSQFNYDTSSPVIDSGSLEIKDSNGNIISHVNDNQINNAVISFTITANDLDFNNVYGDISEINTNLLPEYNNKKADCSSITPSEYLCSFNNININLDSTTNVHIIISAPDLTGNVDPTVITKNIGYDTTGPALTTIKTDKIDNGVSYAGTSTTFILELNDNAGVNKDEIILDLTSIKTGLNKAADECTNSGNDWTCYWYNIVSDKTDGEKTISVSGSDILGNPLTGTLSATITLDKTTPVITSSQIIGIGTGIEAFAGRIKTGDTLEATINIKEKNRVRAYADFSSFVTTQDNITGSCIKEGEDDWTCEFSSSTIDVPNYISGNVNFNIVDFVGNSIQHQEPVEVLWYEDAPGVSYWTSSITCSPQLVDRQITDMINARVYCAIELQPTTADQETLSVSLGSCTGDSMAYVENIQLLNAQTGTLEPYLAVDLIQGEMNTDSLSITCPLQIISRVGTKINKNPEIEPVELNIGFYNMPLGQYGTGIEDKIEDAKDEALNGLWEAIGFLEMILKWAKLICNVLSTIQKINILWQHVTTDLTSAHLASIGTPVEPYLAATKQGACTIDKAVGETAKDSFFLEDICKFVNCQLSPQPPDNEVMGTPKAGSIFDDIGNSLGSWTYEGNELLNDVGGDTIKNYVGKEPYQYMNARDNLLVAIVTGCIPGIINGLAKYRQILCLYADCLEQNAQNNVPIKVCEDQKSYATCKYVLGEVFALLPWTALFDYYAGMIKGALSDPLSAVGIVLTYACEPQCVPTADGSTTWLYTQASCRALAFLSMLGEIINDVVGIIDSFDQIKNDYCERLDDD